jgi:hypothetical protein
MGYLLFAAFGAADFSLSEQYSIQAAIRESIRAGKTGNRPEKNQREKVSIPGKIKYNDYNKEKR